MPVPPPPAGAAVTKVSAGVRAAAAAALISQAGMRQAANVQPISCPAPHKHPTSSVPVATPPVIDLSHAQVKQPAVQTPTTGGSHPQVLPDGTVLGNDRYWLGPLLGLGSFGITYRAVDQRLNRAVAIKEFFPEGAFRHADTIVPPPSLGRDGYEQERGHFLDEARVLAQLQRPGIVAVFDVFEQNDTAYMVMEQIEGRTLVEVLRERGAPLRPADAVRYILAVADALAAVHAQHLLHRDVKPGNIMITPNDQAVLIDFGAARRYDRYQRTSVMTAIGTPGYAPLEQWGSSGRFGPTSDVYALAATLYHLVTGQMPPSAADRATNETLVPPRALNPTVSEPINDAIVKALSVRMDDRQQTMAALAASLRNAHRTRTQAALTTPPALPPPAASHHADQLPSASIRRQKASPEVAPAAVPALAPVTKSGKSAPASHRRRRFPWPRRQRDRTLWAAGVVLAPAVFVTSVVALATLVPFFAIGSAAPSWIVRRHSRRLFRRSLRLGLDGIGVSTVSIVSLVIVLGLTACTVARGTVCASGNRRRLLH